MATSRKDSKGRVLRRGESQRKDDKRYIYQYTDPSGGRRVVYANDLMELREKEKELVRDPSFTLHREFLNFTWTYFTKSDFTY